MKQKSPRQNVSYTRNPMYVFYALGGITLLLISLLFAQGTNVGILEQAFFNVFYRFPDVFIIPLSFVIVIGSVGITFISVVYCVLRSRLDVAIRLLAASTLAVLVSQAISSMVARPRPDQLLNDVSLRIPVSGFGFPAVYVALATAAGLTLSLYVSRVNRKWFIYNIFFVGIAGIFLGINLPLDALSGYGVGLLCFSLVSLGFGSVYYPIDIKKLSRSLTKGGMKGLVLKSASVDARGSVPFFGTYNNGPVFVKVFNQDNNAADWLFKLLRRVQYRRLEDEVPSLTPKRTIEHEAYITMLAKSSAGVRAPQVIGVFKVSHNSYAMATELIKSDGLDKMKSVDITNEILSEVWNQINILHKGRIIHKDLRCANIMIEKATRLPWIIDFGFSESAIDEKSFYKDNVEFIASSATKVGAERAVKVASMALGRKAVRDALPYMQYAALSGATTTDLKKQRGLLDAIRNQMITESKLEAGKYMKAKLSRLYQPRKTKRL